ncbi:hypothetical protein [Candidatus Bathycorpusculum sp.]|jgi:hypothetical protein|uniref:hypothetical protein n=1 Tax=Candidatus Bathycorpusculum sp. TaxID=2994959 RepID=UPI0028303D10|nr:hypothetical protein [Candidatus Termitimicrobium sp.]
MALSVVASYSFRQHFAVLANQAYMWCTDFDPQDHVLMGDLNAKREIIPTSERCITLKDTFQTEKGTVVKEKLVQLDPDQLCWVAIHLSGPNRCSRFIYTISAEKDGSSLEFRANHIEYQNLTQKQTEQLTKQLRKHDADVWALLAKAMKKELRT